MERKTDRLENGIGFLFSSRREKGKGGVGVSPSGRRCCSSTGIKAAGGDIRAGHRRTGGATGLLEAIGLITENFKRNATVPVSQGLPKKQKTTQNRERQKLGEKKKGNGKKNKPQNHQKRKRCATVIFRERPHPERRSAPAVSPLLSSCALTLSAALPSTAAAGASQTQK